MEGKTNGHSDFTFQTSKFRFAHAETIIPLATILGLFKPLPNETMKWDAPPEQQQMRRQWRASHISPFAGNFLFVLYNCSEEFKAFTLEYCLLTAQVKVLHNEVPVEIPGCGSLLCPLEKFKSLFSEYQQCNWKDICGIQPLSCVGTLIFKPELNY